MKVIVVHISGLNISSNEVWWIESSLKMIIIRPVDIHINNKKTGNFLAMIFSKKLTY